MASKKIKKLLAAGLAGYAGAKMLGQKKEMAEYLKTEGGDKSKINYITKKKGFKEKVMDAVNVYKNKGLNTGPGPNKSSSPADVLGGMTGFGLGEMDGAKYGKMIKAKSGVMAKGCKLGRNKRTIIT